MVTLQTIQDAAARIADAIYRSPSPRSESLSSLLGCHVYAKLENLQRTGSFKERGARNRLLSLTAAERARGVIAASAGNHALALAWHGRLLGIGVQVIMPRYAPLVKIANCRRYGADVVLQGESYDDAKAHALLIADRQGLTYIPGFDDDAIIAGQGTIGLELLEDIPDLQAVIVPAGGGGLLAGIAIAIKSLNPAIAVYGVEPENAACITAALAAGQPVRVETKPTLADGLGVALVGASCLPAIQQYVDAVVTVSEADIARSVLRLMEYEKTVVEGAGAAALAAISVLGDRLAGKHVALVLGGGNIDPTILARIIERGLASDGRLCRVRANVMDRPGSLVRLLNVIAAAGASVKDVRHDRSFAPADIALVNVTCLVETRDRAHIAELQVAFQDAGIPATITTGPNESDGGN